MKLNGLELIEEKNDKPYLRGSGLSVEYVTNLVNKIGIDDFIKEHEGITTYDIYACFNYIVHIKKTLVKIEISEHYDIDEGERWNLSTNGLNEDIHIGYDREFGGSSPYADGVGLAYGIKLALENLGYRVEIKHTYNNSQNY